MPIDRNTILSKEAYEIVTKWMDELTEELKTRFDAEFRPEVYILHTVDGEGLPDGIWVLFPKKTLVEMAYSLVEAGRAAMQNFINAGLRDKLG